jgi:hypothetical protein
MNKSSNSGNAAYNKNRSSGSGAHKAAQTYRGSA